MKKSIEYFQKIKDTPRGRAVLFFAFYFFFFLVLIIFIRSSNHQYFNNHEYEKGNDNYVSFDGLKKKNYSFTYSIIVDGKEYLYSGKKHSNRELFTFNNHDYYSDSREYYVKDIDWKKSENPYVFFNFINEDNIITLAEASSYISKTTYESGKIVYSYLLSSNTINSLLTDVNSDFFEEPNKISISVDGTDNLEEIHFYLDSYCVLNGLCQKSLDIKLSYSEFDKIEEISDINIGN